MADLTNDYNTPLSPEQEAQFRKVYPNSQGWKDYDLRGAWLSGVVGDSRGHLPDTYKKPNHPTFSVDSKYNNPQTPAGEWVKGSDKKWVFRATPQNFVFQSPEQLQQYFQAKEPESTLILPDQPAPGAAFQGAFP